MYKYLKYLAIMAYLVEVNHMSLSYLSKKKKKIIKSIPEI